MLGSLFLRSLSGILSFFCLSFLAFIFVLSASVNAFFIEAYTLLENDKIELQGDFSGGQFGSSIEYGDFTGDGETDVIVGSPFASTSGKQWNGAVTFIFGASSGGNTRFSVYGENPGDQLGTSLAVGDFNGDGKDDIAIGGFNALDENSSEERRTGKVYILYGGADRSSFRSDYFIKAGGEHFGDFILNETETVLTGNSDQKKFGISLISADINDNGFSDLIVGSSGAVYVYFGGSSGTGRHPDITIRGEIPGEEFGLSLAAGDFYGNGKKDLAVGAYKADVDDRADVGKVYIYRDVAEKGTVVNSSDAQLTGFYSNSWFGFDLDSGDANGDGISDLLVSSFPYNEGYRSSGVYLYYGKSRFAASMVPDVIIDDPDRDVLPGAGVLLRDFNGNGKDDIVIGAPAIRHSGGRGSGRVYIVFGDDGEDYERHYSLRSGNGINIIYGERDDDWFGYGMNGFDLTGNSINDLAVGARYSYSSVGTRTGKVFVFKGNNEPFGEIRPLFERNGSTVSRGEFLKIVMESFELRERKSGFLESCYGHKEFCLFNFMAMSSFNDISLEPELVLYPDVPADHPFSDYINDATALGLVNGYLGAQNSPFLPDEPITRIQALKVILGAANLVPNIYKFELVDELGGHSELLNQPSYFSDINPAIESMWWMPRYTNFAVEHGILSETVYFHPHDKMSSDILNEWITKTLTLLNSSDNTENEEA